MILILLGIILVYLCFAISHYIVFGRPVIYDKETDKWLDENVRLNDINPTILSKYRDDSNIFYVSYTNFDIFITTYYVDKFKGKDITIVKGTDLHNKIEQKFKELRNENC